MRPGKVSRRQLQRQAWLGAYERELVRLRPELAGKVDWDTAVFLFNQGNLAPEDAARKVAGEKENAKES